MPYVVNGVGTWYYGKRNIYSARGQCESCGNVGELRSYDTGYYLVFVFVPIVPLGQRRILNECPYCKRHQVAKLKDWEKAKKDSLAQLNEQLFERPDDPEVIKKAVALAVTYQDGPLFEKLATRLGNLRLDDPDVQATIGYGYTAFSNLPAAEDAFRRSLRHKDDAEVKEWLAVNLLKQGRPDEAAALLEHIFEGAVNDKVAWPVLLVEGYQSLGMHREALATLERIGQVFPNVAATPDFVKLQTESERRLESGKPVKSTSLATTRSTGYRDGGWGSVVPKLLPPLIAIVALVVYLSACINGGANRQVHVISGISIPYEVSINGAQTVALPPGVRRTIKVSEGDLVIRCLDPKVPIPEQTVSVRTPFFARPFITRTFVINPDQVAVLYTAETEYAAAPRGDEMPPKFYSGQAVYEFAALDYEFAPFPESLKLKRGSRVIKKRVDLVPASLPIMNRLLLVGAATQPSNEGKIAFLKANLKYTPDDELTLGTLSTLAPLDEFLQFAQPYLHDRPVRVDWHRVYQSTVRRKDFQGDLAREYRALLAKEPQNGDLLYLLGRVLTDDAESERYFRQAIAANPPSAYGYFALGMKKLGMAEFAEAERLLEGAAKLRPHSQAISAVHRESLSAVGKLDPVIAWYRDQISKDQAGIIALPVQLVALLQRKGDRNGVNQAIADFNNRRRTADPRRAAVAGATLEAIRSYVEGSEREFAAKVAPGGNATDWQFEAALATRNVSQAAQLLTSDKEVDPVARLLVFLAARRRDPKLADDQLVKAIETMSKGDVGDRNLADVLKGKRPLDPSAVLAAIDMPEKKKVLLAVFGVKFPKHRTEFFNLAKALNYDLLPPRLLLNEVLTKPE